MNNFFKSHPTMTIIIGGAVAIVGNYVGGLIMGKGFGYLVTKQANEVCEDNDLPDAFE